MYYVAVPTRLRANDTGTEKKVHHSKIAEVVDSSVIWGHTPLIEGQWCKSNQTRSNWK